MRSNIGLFISILIAGMFGCTQPGPSPEPLPDRLPMFRDALLTPEWIDDDDPDLDSIHRIPTFTLNDQTGTMFTEKGMENRICVTNFFFTRCRSICPRMTLQMKYLCDTIGDARDVQLLSISVDPTADSIPVLHAYAARYAIVPATWKLLTGPREDIYRLARRGFFAGDSTGLTSASEEFLHTENVILTDTKRRIRGVYNGTLRIEMDRLLEDIRTLRREK